MHVRWPTQSLPSAGWLSMPWWFPPCFSLVRLAQCSLSSAEHAVEGFLLSPAGEKRSAVQLSLGGKWSNCFSPDKRHQSIFLSDHLETELRGMWKQRKQYELGLGFFKLSILVIEVIRHRRNPLNPKCIWLEWGKNNRPKTEQPTSSPIDHGYACACSARFLRPSLCLCGPRWCSTSEHRVSACCELCTCYSDCLMA